MIKRYKWQILAFFLPFLFCFFICVGIGVYPFGDQCILHVDMYHQYCPFFMELQEKLQNGGSPLYSWNLGLGSDFVALFAYYLASPLNWLLLLCPRGLVVEFMTLTILVKIGFCGWSFYLYLKGRFEREGGFAALVFSTAYAMCGFVAVYSWDIMWLDPVALTPLVVLGLERLVKEKKAALYYVTLALAILSNYYISFMLCVFLVFYYIFLFIEQKGGRLGSFFRFAGYSLLAGGTGAVLMLPEMLILGYSGSAGFSLPKKMEWYYHLLGGLVRGSVAADPYTGNDHWPNFYAGAFAVFLFVLYILNRRISWKQKIPSVFMAVFLYVSFANNYLDFFWHGLHFPDSLPGRQSFLLAFVLLAMGYRVILERESVRIWQIITAAAVCCGLWIAAGNFADKDITDELAVGLTVLFFLCYACLFLMSRFSQGRRLGMLYGAAVAIALAELVVNMAIVGFYTTGRSSYLAKMDSYERLLEQTKREGEFSRVEDPERKTKNDDALYGYSSATIFSSLMNIHVSHFFQSVYMEGGKNYYSYNGATPLTSAMLSVRYVLFDNPDEESAVRRLVGSDGNNYLYENNYYLPLGFVMPEEAIDSWDNSDNIRINNLNSLAEALGADSRMLVPVTREMEVTPGETTLTMEEGGYYFAAYLNCDADRLTMKTAGGRERTFSKTTHRYLLELGQLGPGEAVTISNAKNGEISYNVYRLDFEALDAAYGTLAAQTMELTAFSDTKVEGNIRIKEPGRLILTIPNEEGWQLYVDGQLCEKESFKETFISVHLEEGDHQIALSYRTPGLSAGAAVSGGCIGIFVLLQIGRRRIHGKKTD